MKVHKITVLVVDHDDLGAEDVKLELENTSYANDCIQPMVVEIETRDVAWSELHPLNHDRTMRAEFHRLFGEEGQK